MADEIGQQVGTYEKTSDTRKDGVEGEVRAWIERIDLASDEERDWRQDVEDAEKVFDADDEEPGTDFNLYHANIQTLVPALYNSTPNPDVRRRYADDDQVAKEVAEAIDRGLQLSIDAYDFDTTIKQAVFDLALPGRGLAVVDYTAPVTGEGDNEDLAYQEVGCEHVVWDDFRRGPGVQWERVPWVAFRKYYTRDGLKALGSPAWDKIPLNSNYVAERNDAKEKKAPPSIMKTAMVWQIWDKEARKVRYVCPDYVDDFVAVLDDPLDLENFFPTPRPMYSNPKPSNLVPQCEHKVYKNLLVELDDITVRIRRLVKQLRPRALSAVKIADIQGLSQADDGEIIEISDLGAFMDGGGLEKLIHWYPFDPIVKALAQLYIQRDNVKMQIYEVTGMADVMRGQTNPNETAAAQQLKAQWGSLRIQERQQEVQRFIRDLFRLKAEIMCAKYTPETWALITGAPLSPEALALMANDGLRLIKVDVETDSTIQGDTLKNQKQMAEFTNGMGLMLQSLAPAIQVGVVDPVTSAVLIQALARRFRLGKNVEDAFDRLAQQAQERMQQQAANPQPSPEQMQAEAEQQKVQAQVEGEKQKHAMTLDAEVQKHAISEQEKTQQARAAAAAEIAKHKAETAKLQHEAVQADLDRKAQAADKQRDRQMQIRMRHNDQFNDLAAQHVKTKQKQAAAKKAGKPVEDDNEEFYTPLDQMFKGMKGVTQTVQQVGQMMQQMAQAMQQQSQLLSQSLQRLEQIAMAPAVVEYDDQGNPVRAHKELGAEGTVH